MVNKYYNYTISIQHNEESGSKHYILMDGEEVIFSSFEFEKVLTVLRGYENE